MAERLGLHSLKARLLILSIAAVTATWLAAAWVSYRDVRHEVDELLDAHLAQSAGLLLAQTGEELEEIDTEHAPQLHKYARRVAFQLWEDGTRLRLHSVSAPNQRLSAQEEGFSTSVIEGQRWRVFGSWDAQRRFLVQVGERYKAREEIALSVAGNLLLPLAVALPVFGVLIWLSVARSTRPLSAMSEQVSRRTPGNLSPLDGTGAPTEVVPLVEQLNRLLERVQSSIQNERRFTADAAHELRTPLAALKTQAQVARAATEDAARQRALNNVILGCDRAAHLVNQLLTLARLQADGIDWRGEPCDLRELARKTIAESTPLAVSKGIEIELSEGSAMLIDGEEALLRVLLRNLLDNAIRYSPSGTLVSVELVCKEDAITVSVTDQGPGIPPEERRNIGQRFYRILGSGETGSGLGLSIVQRIAELHRASVEYADGEQGRGLRVTVAFQPRREGR